VWQRWFEDNDWVLGSDFVRVVDERPIDVGHIADYLMEGFDGFLDVVEIKRPGGGLRFWAPSRDHGNPIPHTISSRRFRRRTATYTALRRVSGSPVSSPLGRSRSVIGFGAMMRNRLLVPADPAARRWSRPAG